MRAFARPSLCRARGELVMSNVSRLRAVILSCAVVLTASCRNKSHEPDHDDAAMAPVSSGLASAERLPCRDDKKLMANGKLTSCVLANDVTIDGFDCVRGRILELHPNGNMKGCYLKTRKVVDDWSCQDGISRFPSGKLRRCKVSIAKRAGEGTEVRPGDWVTLYEGAGIRRLELASGPASVQGLPCKGYLNFFHENGKLKKCELDEDATIEGKKVSARSDAGPVYVCFDEQGKRVADCSMLGGMTLE
jgi:hypothetical protein